MQGSLGGRFLGVALVAATSFASAVRAEDADKAREHYSVGLRAYDLGNYDEAIAEFEEAYRQKDAPGLLYNIGQAYRLSNRPEEAVRYYRTYLDKKPDAANAADVQAKIDRLTSILEERKAANPPPAQKARPVVVAPRAPTSAPAVSPPPSPLRAPSLAPAPATTKAAPVEAVAAKAPGDRYWTGRRVGWVATGIGAAALALAVYFGVEAHGAAADMEGAAAAGRPFDASVEAKGNRAQTLSRVFLASALVGFGTGGILLGTSGRTPIDAAARASSEESR
ncbi:MAG TPA: tetratricopeptide repeat protein [Myxococcales bacterium]|nr:tetratricopeptide repeat protein [Myxococcales bacterium]